MTLYVPHSIFHLARPLYVRPETVGPYCVYESEYVRCSLSAEDSLKIKITSFFFGLQHDIWLISRYEVLKEMSFESYFLSGDWFIEVDTDNIHKAEVNFSLQ